MGRHEKVSPARTWCLVLILFGSVIHSIETSPIDYDSDVWDLNRETDDDSSEDYWNSMKYFEDEDTKILADGPGRENGGDGESLNFYNSLGSSKHNLHSVKSNPREEFVKEDDDRAKKQPAHTSSSHILSFPLIGSPVLPSSSSTSQSQNYFIIPPREKTFSITSQNSGKEDSTRMNSRKEQVDMDHLSVKQNRIYDGIKEDETLKRERALLRTSSSSQSIHRNSEDNAHAHRTTMKSEKVYHSSSKDGRKVFSKPALKSRSSSYPVGSRDISAWMEKGTRKRNQGDGVKANPSSGFVKYSHGHVDKENKSKRLNIPYRIPFPYVRRGSNKDTYEETGRELENTNEMAVGPLHPFPNGAGVVLQRRNRSKRDSPDVEASSSRTEEMVQEADISSLDNHQPKSVESQAMNQPEGVATNVKNSTPPPQATNPVEALQRLTRLLDRMLRELSQFQQKFTLRLIRMTERQDIDQMQDIMHDFDISPNKPIFFIAGGLKKRNDSGLRTSSIPAKLPQIDESLVNGTEQPISNSETEVVPPLSPVLPVVTETTLASIPMSPQEATTLPVELETDSSTGAPAQVQAEPGMVIVKNSENVDHGEGNVDLITMPVPLNPEARQKRSTPEFDDIQVFPVPGRMARTENPYDDFGEDGWIDFEEPNDAVDDDDNDHDNDKPPFGGSADEDEESPELSPASPSKFIASHTPIDQSHALPPRNDLISSNSKHATTVVGVAISDPIMPIEKAPVPPVPSSSSSSQMLTRNVANDIALLPNGSIMTVEEQQGKRSNDHVDDQAQAVASANIVNHGRTPPPHQPPMKRVLSSNSVEEAKDFLPSGETETKKERIENGMDEIPKIVHHPSPLDTSFNPDVGIGNKNIIAQTQPSSNFQLGSTIPEKLVENPKINDHDIKDARRTIPSSAINNALPLEDNVKLPVPMLSLGVSNIASAEEGRLQSQESFVPVLMTSTEEQVSPVHISPPLPAIETNPAVIVAPHSLADPILETDLGIPQEGINVKNNNPSPQFNIGTGPTNPIPQLIIKEVLPTQKVVNPLTSIENRSEKRVPTTVSGSSINAIVKDDVHLPVKNIPLIPNTDNRNGVVQDNTLISPTMATSASPSAIGGIITTEKKTSPEMILPGREMESGKESFGLGEKEEIPVMKKVGENDVAEQQGTNIGSEIEKLSPNQPTFHAPTVLEESRIMGETDKSVRDTDSVSVPAIIDEGKSSEERESHGGAYAFASEEIGNSRPTKNVFPSVDNDILTQSEVNVSPISKELGIRSPVNENLPDPDMVASENINKAVTEVDLPKSVTTAEKVEMVPEALSEKVIESVGEVNKMKVVSENSELFVGEEKVVLPQIVTKIADEPTSGIVTSLGPVPIIESGSEGKISEVTVPSLADNLKKVDQIVKISDNPPRAINDRVEGEPVGVVPEMPVVILKNADPAPTPFAGVAVANDAVRIVPPVQEVIKGISGDKVPDVAPPQVVVDDKIMLTKTPAEDKVAPAKPLSGEVIESADPIKLLKSKVEPTTSIQGSSHPVSPLIPVSLEENIVPLLPSPTNTQNQVVPVTKISSEPVMAPIALAPYNEGESAIPTIPEETDLDTAFGIKPIATTPNLQIPGLRPTIPERPTPEYIQFMSHGVDLESLYFTPPTTPIVLPSPPVFSGYSPAAIMQRQQQLLNHYFSGLLYRRALPY